MADTETKEAGTELATTGVHAVKELVFINEAPPARRRGPAGKSVWAQRLAPIMNEPDTWAQLPGDFSQSQASQLRKGNIGGVNPKHWEFEGRTLPGPGVASKSGKMQKRSVLFAKYVGPTPRDTNGQ